MDALVWFLGAAFFLVAILVSIGLHELGHMIPAKRFGGKVTQYFIGFGPTVWSRQVGETEYGVKAIPLGGYVKIVGMLPPAAADLADEVTYDADGNPVTRVRKSNTGMFTQLISDARAAEWELVGADDADRLFYKMPWWKKVVVMGGGPTVNILIAFVCYLLVFSLYGNPGEVEADEGRPVVDQVSDCVIPYREQRTVCEPGDRPSPASEAGLQRGDVITAFNGTDVESWGQLRGLIRDNADGDAVITYLRDGQERTGRTSTTVELRPESETDETLVEVGFLGVVPTTHRVTGGPLYTLGQMGHMTVDVAQALTQLPVKVWGVAKAIVGVEERAEDSPVSIVGGSRLAGEVAAHDEIDVPEKVVFFATLVAGFNFFIGMFNFLPLLPLDGGHIASALFEAARRGWARLRRRPDPGYVDAAKLLPVAYVVALAMIAMGGVLIIGDIVVPVKLGF
ncbi:RIP metalloprotease [Nocardioides sp. SYSU D00038]|uniref:M50 family metallopeptidase n=1 Tax=Nocardioides sp. SYSU D00038 TaxID=2812554 RepID=UPI001966E66B|nr:site-2 protease family protein [Nocardioides sp. SYSU D00038]